MASTLRVLVLEDQEEWQSELRRTLKELWGEVQVDVASTLREGLERIDGRSYDLATVDLSLAGGSPEETDEMGLQLVERLLKSPVNRDIGLLVVTANFTVERVYTLFRDYRPFDVIDKHAYTPARLLRTACAALLDARRRRAERQENQRYRLTIAFGRESWLGSEIHGPGPSGTYRAERGTPLGTADLVRRADQINLWLLSRAPAVWREEARSIGQATLEALKQDRRIAADLDRVRALSDSRIPLWLEMSGPSAGLGIPFELLHDGDDYFCLHHILTRRLSQEELPLQRKTESFRRFLTDLAASGERLRVLLIGANSDGKIPAVEAEVTELAEEIRIEVQRLGLEPRIDVLTGNAATWEAVRDALHSGGHHIFHYAGHGRYRDELPETSGPVLGSGASRRVLTASDLNLLASGTELRLAFLSCCLGGRTAAQPGRGDFHGMLEALTRADVPSVLGYRWIVSDGLALEFAMSFYRALWLYLSPGTAILEARKRASMGLYGRDDETWASPILLNQSD
jgi:hypothetical protein